MCTRNIVETTATVAGGVAGSIVPGAGTLIGAGAGAAAARSLTGKRVIGSDIIPKPVSPIAPKPPEDLAGRKRREAARALQRNLAGRPGPGRESTIFSRGTGAGPAGLKTKTGQ